MGVTARRSTGGVDLQLELDRQDLLPGRLVDGVLRLTFEHGRDVRGAYATLVGTEHWQVEETRTDSEGRTHTETVTRREELPRVPVALSGPRSFAAGERAELRFQVPVPALGPPTVEATVAGVDWELDVKLDVPGFDPGIVLPVRILQPTALLRAGVVHVEQFALWPLADAETGAGIGSIGFDPVPLCVGAPFAGRLVIDTHDVMDLQEVRVEVRVGVRATVPSGRHEERTIWTGRVAGPGRFGGDPTTLDFRAVLPTEFLPTAELPHGRTDATIHVILAKAWARDPHLVRDVAICSTTEI